MQVITVAHHEQPAVTMRMLVRAGAAQDPEGKGGLAELVAKLLDQGATTRSASRLPTRSIQLAARWAPGLEQI